MTEQLARAASFDAANAQMRKAGRTSWNEEDYELAWAEFERLWPPDAQERRIEKSLVSVASVVVLDAGQLVQFVSDDAMTDESMVRSVLWHLLANRDLVLTNDRHVTKPAPLTS